VDKLLADEGECQLLEIVTLLRVGALDQTAELLSYLFDLLFTRLWR
jgi:hypothetical protein